MNENNRFSRHLYVPLNIENVSNIFKITHGELLLYLDSFLIV